MTGLVRAQGIRLEVMSDAAGQRIRHHQRRTHQVVGAHIDADAALEVTVAAEHADRDKAMLVDALLHVGGQRTGVANAGGAAVADDVEAQLLKIRQQARLGVVIRDHTRAGRERGLHPWRHCEALFNSLLRQQARSHHHRRIRGVGATGN